MYLHQLACTPAAVAEIKRFAGTQFNPGVVTAFRPLRQSEGQVEAPTRHAEEDD